MKFVLSTTVLASVVAPAVSFSYLDSLGGSAAVSTPAPYTPEAAPAAPVEAAAPAAPYQSSFGEVELAATSAGYLDSMNIGEEVSGPGMMAYKDSLNSGQQLAGGAGIQNHVSGLAPTSAIAGGAGIQTHVSSLSPANFDGMSFSPYGEAAAVSFSGATSADGVSFTLETGDISGLVNGLGPGGTLRLTGSIDSVSYN